MIDDKKIEGAKEEIYEDRFLLNGEEIVFNNDEKEEMFYEGDIKQAIGLGAKWAINEFLNDLWHDTIEEPKEKVPLLYYRKHKFLPFMVDKHSDVYERNTLVYNFDITKWLYIEDLFPKEGGENG